MPAAWGAKMPSWLSTALSSTSEATAAALSGRIGAAFLLDAAVAALDCWARRGESISATFLTTLVLLAGLIAMATRVIGDNVARAFSLVGVTHPTRGDASATPDQAGQQS